MENISDKVIDFDGEFNDIMFKDLFEYQKTKVEYFTIVYSLSKSFPNLRGNMNNLTNEINNMIENE
jgi:hypothetical protein